MKNYKILLQYDGTRYNGWQRQKNVQNTIQGKVEDLLSKMTGKQIEINGAGRTDAGVHAYGQVANVILDTEKNEAEIQAYMNRYLPEDIVVARVEAVEYRFHSRLNATGKEYWYCIQNGPVRDPFKRKYTWYIEETLNLDAMREAKNYLIGKHDFKSFCSNQRMKKSTERTIYSIHIDKKKDAIAIKLCGDGFLYNMVRIIVGTLVEIGNGTRNPEEMAEILMKKDRQTAGITAPAHGLYLMEVFYDKFVSEAFCKES